MIFYIFAGVLFLGGVGVGVGISTAVRIDRASTTDSNPFLDEADSEVADELRAEGAQSVQERIERRKSKILAQAVAQGRITNDGVEDLFCISDRTASVYLKDMVTTGQLTRQGAGRSTYYTPVE